MKSLFAFVLLLLIGCKPKSTEPEKKFISLVSLIESQVAHVDTSLYAIIKIVSTDSTHHDTTFIRREDFRKEASEFLDIPDLSNPKIAKRYKEEPARYDELMGRVIISYSAIDPGKEEFKNQELLVTPNLASGDKINNIITTRVISNKDSFVQKNMLWRMDKSFQVTTILQKPGGFEKVTTSRVVWNDDELQ
ncbi:MAG TPA: hypothetical protein PLU37_09025 [Chitinophagaceae bacterium]|nr:hypothetical protein [Chitinophagaceae bacterium]MCB9054615.1 hypothetical protein [Chitinophagales bacterium]HPG11658.1 hypothetical protein [Chitinophagaceae bacterium]HRX93376.1 hypothetical protein [Chitinophagaceae bacterium]